MKVVVIGATGTIGASVVELLQAGHEVVRVSRSGPLRIDMTDPTSIEQLFVAVRDIDAVVCCAVSVPLAPLATLSDRDFVDCLQGKLFGQVSLTRQALAHLNDRGSITLTSGKIPALSGSTAGALANSGLEAFVRAAALEMPRGIRINVVCPGWVKETLTRMGNDGAEGIAAIEVARTYVNAVTGDQQGQILVPG
jgi:NAD(P)-dependent dehydrogenase (short-subunit alcohol dehydrogenase family)